MKAWFQRIFGGQGAPADAVPGQGMRAIQIARNDQTQLENGDVIECLEFFANRLYRTPLSALLKNGERFDGLLSAAPTSSDYAHGYWQFKTKSFRDLGFDRDELPLGTTSSSMGYADSVHGLRFLVEFRKIVEGAGAVSEKAAAIRRISERVPETAEAYAGALRNDANFPESYFIEQIEVIPGIGRASAKKLYEAGFCDLDALSAATPESLAAAGIAKGLASKVMAHFKKGQN